MHREIDAVQRVLVRAGIAEGDVFQPQLVFPVRALRQGLAALHAEGLRQLKIFADDAEIETLPPQRAELGENAVELFGIRADGGEAQQEFARAHSPGERLAQQEVIGKAVAQGGKRGVNDICPEIHPLAPLDKGVKRAERFVIHGFEPRAHAENADVLAEDGALRLVGNIVHALFQRGGLVAVAVAPLVDAPVDEILRRGRHGERGEKPRARIREQQQIHHKAQRRGEKLLLIHPERLARAAVIYGRAYGLLLQLENFRVLGERIGHHAGLIMDLADEREAHIDSREHRRVLQIGADRRAHEQHPGEHGDRRENTRKARPFLYAADDLRREQETRNARARHGERFYDSEYRHIVPVRRVRLPQHPEYVLPQIVARLFRFFFHRNHLFFARITLSQNFVPGADRGRMAYFRG